MEANKKPNNSNYISGNAARKLHAVPDYAGERQRDQDQRIRRERQQRHQEEIRRRNRTRRNRERAYNLDLVTLFSMLAAVAVIFIVMVQYLQTQAEYTRMTRQIATLESNLVTLRNDNNAAMERVNESVDLDYIYEVATKELGMVFNNNNKVFTFKNNPSDYIRKYNDIPTPSKKSWLDKILD